MSVLVLDVHHSLYKSGIIFFYKKLTVSPLFSMGMEHGVTFVTSSALRHFGVCSTSITYVYWN